MRVTGTGAFGYMETITLQKFGEFQVETHEDLGV